MKSLVEYVCIYRQNLALNDLQRLICHKTQITNQPTNYQMVCRQTRISPWEWDAENSLGFWDANRSPNLGPKTMLFTAEWFFLYIIIFRWLILFSLLRLWTVRVLVQVFTLARGGYDNHKCHNKNPRWQMRLDVIDVMPGSDGLEFWWFLKKQLVEIWTWARAVQLESTGCAAH